MPNPIAPRPIKPTLLPLLESVVNSDANCSGLYTSAFAASEILTP